MRSQSEKLNPRSSAYRELVGRYERGDRLSSDEMRVLRISTSSERLVMMIRGRDRHVSVQ